MKVKETIYKLLNGWSPFRIYLAVNIINICNRSCSFCPYHGRNLPDNYHRRWFKAQPEHLSIVNFARFLNKPFARFLIKRISITGKGEPLMHPQFSKFCNTINAFKIPFSITTNGDYFSAYNLNEILALKYLTMIRISLYDKRQMRFDHPKIQYFNMTGKPIEGLPVVQLRAVFGVKHKNAMCDFNKKDFCSRSYHMLSVNTDGSITACNSFDQTSTIEDSLWKIWNGNSIRRYRRQAVNGRNMKLADCNNCCAT